MVAFNFKPEFAPKIKRGEKLSTIRSTKRCNVGDTMQLYTGQRTKKCNKIRADVVCCGVAPIMMSKDTIWKIIGLAEGHIKPSRKEIHKQEGFKNAQAMIDFFEEHYGLPYSGYIHAWRITK